ncbi:hypothetical protein [Streptomyces beijiangensis]|uniref:Uncharacterized protein n=1 Tax=Streptomyces beijiangensis TaxID=163361 RepID=A0A939F3K2_9ACTN|nr:hypothetical protein [Streptomyces beijiangensis]MBO0511089.1 hypothetical protein [Streptomyces beijiangensis]
MNLKKTLAVTATAIGLGMSIITPAHASTGEENQESPDACMKSQSASVFKYAIYFNSNYGGAYRNVGYPVYDFADERVGGSPQAGTQPLLFCHGGSGNNQGIKNNAASVRNKHSTYYAVTYYNSGYKGSSDWATPNSSRNLSQAYNQNASFNWSSL